VVGAKRFRVDSKVHCEGALCSDLNRRGVNPIKLASLRPTSIEWPATLMASAFSRLSQYASSPCNGACCYAKLAVSSLAVAVTIASTHCAYTERDGQAELTCVAG